MKKSSYRTDHSWSKFFTTWQCYWEGVLILYFFGMKWAIVWCIAWSLLGIGVRLGRSMQQ